MTGGVPALHAIHHLLALEKVLMQEADDGQRNGRTAIATVAGVPLGVIRRALGGTHTNITAEHEQRILATSVDTVRAETHAGGAGSRGRPLSAGGQRVPAGPAKQALTRLAAAGWGPNRIARELGYVNGFRIGGRTVTRRVAQAVLDLDRQVAAGELKAAS